MDVGIFYEIQVASPLKHREREYQVFHQVLDQVVFAEQAGFDSFEEVTSDRNREIKEYEGVDPRKVNLQFLIDNGMCVVGSPDTCIKQIERIQNAANLDLFLCMMQFWSIPHEKTMHAIDLFGKYVIPHFKKKA